MKKYIGVVILLIAFVCFMGCTQTPVTEAVTTLPTTVPTVVPTTELTPASTTLPITDVKIVIPVATRTTSPMNMKVVTAIHMRNNTFVPEELTALPGTGIAWINDDSVVHSVKTIGNATGMFNSGDILPGSQWSYTFGQREGRYEFTCSYHPEMKGAIIIKYP
jgi:plastocyanin